MTECYTRLQKFIFTKPTFEPNLLIQQPKSYCCLTWITGKWSWGQISWYQNSTFSWDQNYDHEIKIRLDHEIKIGLKYLANLIRRSTLRSWDQNCLIMIFEFRSHEKRSRCDVRQFFLRQLFWFCSTIEEWVVFRPCFCTCHWSKKELIELKCCLVLVWLILTSTFDFF